MKTITSYVISIALAASLAWSLGAIKGKINKYEPLCLPSSWQVDNTPIQPNQVPHTNINWVYERIET